MGKVLDGLLRRPRRITPEEYQEKMEARHIDGNGMLMPDEVPIAPPIGYIRQPSMVEMIRQAVQSETLRLGALQAGHETFEESEDFDVDDDPVDYSSPWENDFDPPLKEILRAGEEEVARKATREAAKPPENDPAAPPADTK